MKTSLQILGAFCIAYNLSNPFHELGHCIAVWFSGGSVYRVVLNPFSWSWTLINNDPTPLFTSWGGVLFGVLLVLGGALPALWIRSTYLAPLHVLGGCALAVNGIYLSIAAFAMAGDAGALLEQGVPRVIVVAVGLVLLGLACLWMALVQSRIGIAIDTTLSNRLVTLHLGITPYLLAMCAYVLVADRRSAPLFIAFAGVGIVSITVIALLGHFLRNLSGRLLGIQPVESTRKSAGIIFVLGLSVVIGELIYFNSNLQRN